MTEWHWTVVIVVREKKTRQSWTLCVQLQVHVLLPVPNLNSLIQLKHILFYYSINITSNKIKKLISYERCSHMNTGQYQIILDHGWAKWRQRVLQNLYKYQLWWHFGVLLHVCITTHAAVPNLRLGRWQDKVQVKGKWRRWGKLWICSQQQYVCVKKAMETHVITFYLAEKAGQRQNSVVYLCRPAAPATKQPHIMHGKDESHH